MDRIGIVAGNGKLPLIAAQSARSKGRLVYVCAICDETDPSIESIATKTIWVKLGEIKKLAHFFKSEAVEHVFFEGKITKTSLFKGHIKPDLDMVMLFARLKDRTDDTILGGICDYLEAKGLHVLDSTIYLDDCVPEAGVLTKKRPSKKEEEDIRFGWRLAKESGRLDIGQSVVVKDKAVLAIEAIEGTDAAIKRGGELGSRDVVVVKVAKPNQDMRFDVPAIGINTIRSMISAKAKVLAFEAGKTIIIDKEELLVLANAHNMIIVGYTNME